MEQGTILEIYKVCCLFVMCQGACVLYEHVCTSMCAYAHVQGPEENIRFPDPYHFAMGKTESVNWTQWCTPLIPVLGKAEAGGSL